MIPEYNGHRIKHGANDLRYFGRNSDVTVYHPDGTITIEPAVDYMDIPKRFINMRRLYRDRQGAKC